MTMHEVLRAAVALMDSIVRRRLVLHRFGGGRRGCGRVGGRHGGGWLSCRGRGCVKALEARDYGMAIRGVGRKGCDFWLDEIFPSEVLV